MILIAFGAIVGMEHDGNRVCHLLLSDNLQDRTNALTEIERRNKDLGQSLIEFLQDTDHTWETSYHGKTHMAILALSEIRSDNAVDVLLKRIDFELNRDSFPLGDQYPEDVYFPCVGALARIGIVAVRKITLALANGVPEKSRDLLIQAGIKAYGGEKIEYENYVKAILAKVRLPKQKASLQAVLDSPLLK